MSQLSRTPQGTSRSNLRLQSGSSPHNKRDSLGSTNRWSTGPADSPLMSVVASGSGPPSLQLIQDEDEQQRDRHAREESFCRQLIRSNWKVLLVLLLTAQLAATVFLFARARQDHVDEVAHKNDERLGDVFDAYVYALRRATEELLTKLSLLALHMPFVDTPQAFADFAQGMRLHKHVSWLPLVQHEDRAEYERHAHAQLTAFLNTTVPRNITDLHLDAAFTPNATGIRSEQPFYLPITYAHPPFKVPVFLADILAFPNRYTLLMTAMANEGVFASGRSLYADPAGGLATVTGVAVRVVDPSNSSRILGAVMSAGSWQDWLTSALREEPPEDIELRVYETTLNASATETTGCPVPLMFGGVRSAATGLWELASPSDLLLCHNTSGADELVPDGARATMIDAGVASYLIVLAKADGFDEEPETSVHVMILGSAVVGMSMLLIIFVVLNASLLIAHLKHSHSTLERHVKEVRGAELEAREAAEHRDQFLAFLSHEMRNPLFSLVGLIDEAAEQAAVGGPTLESMRESAGQIERTLNTVVNVQNMMTGAIELIESSFDISHMMELLSQRFSEQAQLKQVVLSVEVDDDVPRILVGDELRVFEVVCQLVSNAIQFTADGSLVQVTVTLQDDANPMHEQLPHSRSLWGRSRKVTPLRQDPNDVFDFACDTRTPQSQKRSPASQRDSADGTDEIAVQFVVRDQGPGIERQRAETIFEPYTRERIASANRDSGSKLGLPIVRLLCRRMGGFVRVRSGVGRGSEFTAVVVLKEAKSSSSTPESSAMRQLGNGVIGPPAAVPGSTRSIHAWPKSPSPVVVPDKEEVLRSLCDCTLSFLVVDDQRINRRLITRFLRKIMPGALVCEAVDGVDAVDKVRAADRSHSPFACVFMDIQMPRMTGTQAAEHLRQRGFRGVIIAVTGGTLEEEIATYLAAGMHDVIHKPCKQDDFEQKLCVHWQAINDAS